MLKKTSMSENFVHYMTNPLLSNDVRAFKQQVKDAYGVDLTIQVKINIPLGQILSYICDYFNCSIEDIKKPDQKRGSYLKKMLFSSCLRYGVTKKEIDDFAQQVMGKDRTTVCHHIKQHGHLISMDSSYLIDFEKLVGFIEEHEGNFLSFLRPLEVQLNS